MPVISWVSAAAGATDTVMNTGITRRVFDQKAFHISELGVPTMKRTFAHLALLSVLQMGIAADMRGQVRPGSPGAGTRQRTVAARTPSPLDSITLVSRASDGLPELRLPASVESVVRRTVPSFQPIPVDTMQFPFMGERRPRQRTIAESGHTMVLDLDADGVNEALLLGLSNDTLRVVGVTLERGQLVAKQLARVEYQLIDPDPMTINKIAYSLTGIFARENDRDRGQPFRWVDFGPEGGEHIRWTRRAGRWVEKKITYDWP